MTSREDLYTLDPDEFVAARDGLVRELRAQGDKDAAGAVKRLRRPPVPVWALNQVAADAPELVSHAVEAARAATAAQRDVLQGADRDVLRDALTQRRRAFDAVVARAREIVTESGRRVETYERELEDALQRLSSAPALLDDWSHARLTHLDADSDGDVLAELAASVDTHRGRSVARGSAATSAAHKPSRQLVHARDRRDRNRAEAQQVTDALERAQRALQDAQAIAREAERGLRAAEAEHESARRAHDRAVEALRRSEEEVDRLES